MARIETELLQAIKDLRASIEDLKDIMLNRKERTIPREQAKDEINQLFLRGGILNAALISGILLLDRAMVETICAELVQEEIIIQREEFFRHSSLSRGVAIFQS